MQPHNELVTSGEAFCLADPGAAYALYLPRGGGATVKLAAEVQYVVQWWNPTNSRDGQFQNRRMVDGGLRELIPPGGGDWAVRVLATSK
jgi:hypothetical protein